MHRKYQSRKTSLEKLIKKFLVLNTIIIGSATIKHYGRKTDVKNDIGHQFLKKMMDE
jgi:hypothetical protein